MSRSVVPGNLDRRESNGPWSRSKRSRRDLGWLGGLLISLGLTGSAAWAGEYFTEEVTSPSIEVVHGWQVIAADRVFTISNSSRGGFNVPMEIDGTACGAVELIMLSGRILPLGQAKDCTINLFPALDKMINQEIESLRARVDDQVIEIPLDDNDRLALAQVGNQSRDTFIFFQQELSRVLALLQREDATQTPNSPTALAQPTPIPFSPPTIPAPAAPATPGSVLPPQPPAESGVPPTINAPVSSSSGTSAETEDDFVIIDQIQEEQVGAGSRLTVRGANRGPYTVLQAQAQFNFYQGDQLVDTRIGAFDPSDVPPGQEAIAQVIKTESNWDRVTVKFQWQRP